MSKFLLVLLDAAAVQLQGIVASQLNKSYQNQLLLYLVCDLIRKNLSFSFFFFKQSSAKVDILYCPTGKAPTKNAPKKPPKLSLPPTPKPNTNHIYPQAGRQAGKNVL